MNARMYAVTPEVEGGLACSCSSTWPHEAGVPLTYLPYPAPQPLEELWRARRPGRRVHVRLSDRPEAGRRGPARRADPRAPWAPGAAVYRTDLIVRSDAPYRTLADTFGGAPAGR